MRKIKAKIGQNFFPLFKKEKEKNYLRFLLWTFQNFGKYISPRVDGRRSFVTLLTVFGNVKASFESEHVFGENIFIDESGGKWGFLFRWISFHLSKRKKNFLVLSDGTGWKKRWRKEGVGRGETDGLRGRQRKKNLLCGKSVWFKMSADKFCSFWWALSGRKLINAGTMKVALSRAFFSGLF